MNRRTFIKTGVAAGITLMLPKGLISLVKPPPPLLNDEASLLRHKVTVVERRAAAKRAKALGFNPGVADVMSAKHVAYDPSPLFEPDGTYIPHYFGPYANYANSPLPNGPVTRIVLEDGGNGYVSAPNVIISDVYGTGQGAEATAVVVNGRVTQVQLKHGGEHYSAPVVTFKDGGGTGAAAVASIGDRLGTLSGGIRKFVDRLPGLGEENKNELGQYIPVGVPDTQSYPQTDTKPAADYYEIALVEYEEKLHSDLPKTRLRGYVQLETPVNASISKHVPLYYPDGNPILKPDGVTQYFAIDDPHYLGVQIISQRDVPVRIKFNNLLPTGDAGKLFIPVDETVMGAGDGPIEGEKYPQNRATVHLHGAFTPWISDGTPHQWVVPAGEPTPYQKGASAQNVPDMYYLPPNYDHVDEGTPGAVNDPGPGALTFYYTNQQSARLMFYHEHAYGITRLNVYVGQAAGYLITDQVEQDLINGTFTPFNPEGLKVLPDLGIPLIIQDKTFVDPDTIDAQDPNWRYGGWALDEEGKPVKGALWVPSVYMPAQNPYDPSGANAFGRWQYGPWFWPPTTNVENLPKPNEYYDPENAPWEPPTRPIMPNPSMGMEAYNDAPLVNGCVYPYMNVEPKAYRFRILNAANDRFFNLQFYVADPDVVTSDRRTNTEVKMVPALATPGFPPTWSTDGRIGGVPDPFTAGPSWIQVGTEGGFLPAPVVIPPQPINWNMNATAFNVGNVTDHSLLLGSAERADVIVDFSQYAGQTLILYNDAPAAFPASDPRYDYYTDHPDETATGGAPSTKAGFGPNTRTIMQFRVGSYDGDSTAGHPIERIDVVNGGSNYIESPRVEISGGSGSGASALAFCAIDRITIVNPGRGYTDEAIVDIVGGGGSGATAIAKVTDGQVTGVEITNPGSGYTSAPTVTITYGPYRYYFPIVANSGSDSSVVPGENETIATAVATLRVDEIQVTNPGAGYYSVPTVRLYGVGGRGYGATALARLSLANGESYDIGTLESVFSKTDTKDGVFETVQDPIIMPQAAYNSAYNADFPDDNRAYVQLFEFNKTFTNAPLSGITLIEGGSDYTSAPVVNFTGGNPITPATATAVLSASVYSLQLVQGGTGYTSAPTVEFSGGEPGTGAVATATISNGVTQINLVNGGSGYDPATSIVFSGGGGTGAAATTVITDGVITGIIIENPGSGYLTTPTIEFVDAGLLLGMGAEATAVLSGVVDHIELIDGGSGYTTEPVISFVGGDPVVPATATATIKGPVGSLELIDGGIGYKSLPTITFTGGGGDGARAEATLNQNTIALEPKAIHDEMGAAYDLGYGRMGGLMGLELPVVNSLNQNMVLYGYPSPPVEIFKASVSPLGTAGDGTQFWKITQNGVDTHPIHVHLFNVQLVNRVAWDGALLPPEPNELGWKETVRVNPLEHAIVVFRPVTPENLPFEVPNSVRLIDPSQPEGAMLMGGPAGFIDPRGIRTEVLNHEVNFGWEYVWHCHILSHEEMDMMHAMAFAVPPNPPTELQAVFNNVDTVTLTWSDNSITETGFVIERLDTTLPENEWELIGGVEADVTTFDDITVSLDTVYKYRVFARNTVGDTTAYAGSLGYPTMDADSEPTNEAEVTTVIV